MSPQSYLVECSKVKTSLVLPIETTPITVISLFARSSDLREVFIGCKKRPYTLHCTLHSAGNVHEIVFVSAPHLEYSKLYKPR